MKLRKFSYSIFMAVCFCFVVMSLSGCGSDSHNDIVLNPSASDDDYVNMSNLSDENIAAFKAYLELMSELSADGTIATLGDNLVTFTCYTQDELEKAVQKLSDDGATQEEIDAFLKEKSYDLNADTFIKAYNEDNKVLLFYDPTLDFINNLRSDLGLDPEDKDLMGGADTLEAYAVAIGIEDGFYNYYSYVVPSITSVYEEVSNNNPELDSDVTEPDENDVIEENTNNGESQTTSNIYGLIDLQIERLRDLYHWSASIVETTAKNKVTAANFEAMLAADNDLTKIADAQTKTFDFSYADVKVNGVSFNGTNYDAMKYTLSRRNTVSYTIFSAHSFSNGNDYYLVQSTATTVPKNFADKVVEPMGSDGYTFNYLYGYTRQFGVEQWLGEGDISVNDVSLIKNTPSNVNRSTTYTKGMSWTLSGKVGLSQKGKESGGSAEVGGSVTYSTSETKTTTEYSIVNTCNNKYASSAGWYADVATPTEGSGHFVGLAPYRKYWGINATPASRNQLQYDSEWIWEVSKNYWKNNGSIPMKAQCKTLDGLSTGVSHRAFKKYDQYNGYYTMSDTKSLELRRPPHTVVSKKNFSITKTGAEAQSFTLLAEDSWALSDIPSWVAFTATSGSSTGADEYQLLFDVKANTTGSPRKAEIKLKSGRDTITLQIDQTGI